MDKKQHMLVSVFAVCGIIGGILMVVAGFMGDAFPRPLWLVASVCMFLNVIGILFNYRCIHKQEKVNTADESK